MKTLKLVLLLALPLPLSARAEEARFFRIVGPVASTIAAFSAEGYVTWTNALTNATFTVQMTQSLLGQSNWLDYIQVPVTNPATTHRLFDLKPPANMAFIPAGSFTMGDAFNEGAGDGRELPTNAVYVSAFYMDRYEVTKGLWDEVYQWATNHGYSFEYGAAGKTNNHPAQSMTWYDCVKWCNARSEQEERVPAFYTDVAHANVYRSGQTNVQNAWVKWHAGYRLPTEAGWEKAARGGASGQRFPWSDTDNIAHSRANYEARQQDGTNYYTYDESLTAGYHPTFNDGVYPYTSPVGYFAVNGYGLYDMAGNVWEWSWDWYGAYSGSQTDPRGPTSGSSRVFRGGSWYCHAICLRAATRDYSLPTRGYYIVGFRCALPLSQP